MTRTQTRPGHRDHVLSTYLRQIEDAALLTSAEERALARYIQARPIRRLGRGTPAAASSRARMSA